MALHLVDATRSERINIDVSAADLSTRALPKHRLPEQGVSPAVASAIVRDELLLDGNARQDLATFCTTWVEPEVAQLMTTSIDKNLIDTDEYPRSMEIESRCVNIIANLWNAPDAAAALGCSTTGSSEAAILGGLAMKWRWRHARQRAKKPADRPNLVCGPVQVCWKKFAKYFDVELREIPLQAGASGMTPEQVQIYCDDQTIGVVATLGVTFTGAYEPVSQIADALDTLEEATGLDIPLHVDAASGGFVAPFVQPYLKWDFRIARVKSINASGHKYGLAPLGVGWAIWRDASQLPADLIFNVDYLGGNVPTFALNFSRPAGAIIAQYYNFIRHGYEGYQRIQESCVDTARQLARDIDGIGPFELVYDGNGGLPAVTYALKDRSQAGFSLYDLSDRLRMRGWQLASYPLPTNRDETVVQRILIRHGVSRDLIALFVEDLHRAVDHFKRHPAPAGCERRVSYHH